MIALRPKLWLVLAVALAGVLHWVSASPRFAFDPYAYNLAIIIGVNIILAVGLNLVNGYTGQFSLGHAGFMAVGSYSAAAVTNLLGPVLLPVFGGAEHWAAHALLFACALVAGGVAAALAGLCVGVPSLRLRGDYLAIVTLGFGEIIRVIIQNMDAVGGPRGWSVSGVYTNLFWTYGVAALAIYVVLSLVHSTWGRAFPSVRDDELAAEAMGINTTKFKVIAFVVAAGFAGVAGGLYAHYFQYINPSGFDFMYSVWVVVMVILGGMGSTPGVIAAAVVVTLLPEGLRWFAKSPLLDGVVRHLFAWVPPENFPAVAEKAKGLFENRMIFFSLLLIVLMLTRPQGLFGDANAARRAQPDRPRRIG